MTPKDIDLQALRRLATDALDGDWELQSGSSWRRIGSRGRNGNVLCPTNQAGDGHPDLLAAPGVLDYIIAAQPSVLLQLVDRIERLEQALAAPTAPAPFTAAEVMGLLEPGWVNPFGSVYHHRLVDFAAAVLAARATPKQGA